MKRAVVVQEVAFWRAVLTPHLTAPEVLNRSIITAARNGLRHHGEVAPIAMTMHRRRKLD